MHFFVIPLLSLTVKHQTNGSDICFMIVFCVSVSCYLALLSLTISIAIFLITTRTHAHTHTHTFRGNNVASMIVLRDSTLAIDGYWVLCCATLGGQVRVLQNSVRETDRERERERG